MVIEPEFARDVDFVYNHWPTLHPRSRPQSQFAITNTDLSSNRTMNNGIGGSNGDKELGSAFSSGEEVDEDEIAELYEELKKEQPRVTKYCLMSAAGSWTDFHVDFGGTSVWYHIYSGSKIFYFIEPTPQNLRIYSKWATTSNRYEFLPDLITAAGGDVYEVPLHQGQTLFIASGWIHAVYTPDDSLVFGGNFVHKHSLEMQLTIYRLEKQMKVGKEYKFPNYQKLMWYAARDFLTECTNLPVSQRNVEEGNAKVLGANETVKKENEQQQHDQVQAICSTYPTRILKGYMALAKELERWSNSKEKRTIEQYPENMNVAEVARELGNMMKLCMACTHINEKGATKSAKPPKPKAISTNSKEPVSDEQPTKVASEEDRPDLGPGWTVSIIPRKTGRKCDYFYNSPMGLRFKSLKQAKATAKRSKAKANRVITASAVTTKLVSTEQQRVETCANRPDLGPGWKVSIVPRKVGRKCDYYYYSPEGIKFKSLKQAKATAQKLKSKEASAEESALVGSVC